MNPMSLNGPCGRRPVAETGPEQPRPFLLCAIDKIVGALPKHTVGRPHVAYRPVHILQVKNHSIIGPIDKVRRGKHVVADHGVVRIGARLVVGAVKPETVVSRPNVRRRIGGIHRRNKRIPRLQPCGRKSGQETKYDGETDHGISRAVEYHASTVASPGGP